MTIANRDTSTLSALAAQLQAETFEAVQAELEALRMRYPELVEKFFISLSGNALDPARRQEFSQLVRAGKMFGGNRGAGPVAAQFSFVQLFNNSLVGKKLLVLVSTGYDSGNSDMLWGLDNATRGAAQAGNNLLAGNNGSVAGLMQQGTQAGIAFSVGQIYQERSVARLFGGGNGSCVLVELPVGTGLTCFATVVNTTLVTNWIWSEVEATYP